MSSCALIFLLLCRLLANFIIPLNDTTEARYSEIARKMLETGDWVTLYHDYGIPFWAKPPLSTWLAAFSMKLFGVNEFAARFPSLLLSLAVLALVWQLARKQLDELAALVAVVVLAGSFYFFLDAGAVMTEPALIFSTTLAFVSFWFAVRQDKVLWSYLFFVGLGLGLLAKGPIALVLVGLPLFFWVLINNAWLRLWRKLPWIKGTLLMGLIALPWYFLAERHTPGFLNYFIMGEHIHRFLTPGWAGDKYGMAHHAPKGMIWPYALIGLMPWTLILFFWLIKYRKEVFIAQEDRGWMSYLFLFTLMPLLFFTFAGNIIYPYVFPVLPAFALLFMEVWKRTKHGAQNSLWLPYVALTAGFFALTATAVFLINPNQVAKTQKPIIDAWLQLKPSTQSELFYWGAVDFSAQFYSRGKAKPLSSLNDLCRAFHAQKDFYLVINAVDFIAFPRELTLQFQIKQILNLGKNQFFLLRYAPGNKVLHTYCK
ncbi:glycosyltransferase family 39 protein [Legionella sp. km772]|nr:glycosyltransferase family 39 protein [Legionella sp. km772]